MTDLRQIIYFSPSTDSAAEIESIGQVVEHHRGHGIDISISAGWPNLMRELEATKDALVVFRLDSLESNNMMIDEVLSMLSSLSRFVADSRRIDIAVVVPKPCDDDLMTKLKRNQVLGVIPGMRFFNREHSLEAYRCLLRGESHWPEIVVAPKFRRLEIRKKEVALTDRQDEIFRLITRQGLSNRNIARKLNITEHTVKGHVSAIMRRCGVRNRSQLILSSQTGIMKQAH